MLIGSHVGMKGKDMFLGSVKEALSYGANTFMVYTGAPQNTRRKKIEELRIEDGTKLMKEHGMETFVVHAPYIINLANTTKPETFELAVEFLEVEVERTKAMGSHTLVLHPGSHVGAGVDKGIDRIIEGLNQVMYQDMPVHIALETMAGKGSEIGREFEELKRIYDGVKYPEKLRVCFDTCHVSKSAKTREWLQKVAFVSDTVPMMPPKIKPRIFNAVSEALYRDSKLRVKFHNSRGEENEAVVSPLGLVQQVQRLYLICQFEGYNNIRHLALHRMDEAEVTAFPSVRPQDFSLSQYVASRHFNYSNGGKIHLLIEFTNPETAVNLSETPFNPTQTLQQLEDGAWRLEADMDDTVQLTGWIEAWRERGGFRKVEKTPIEA